MGQNLPPFTVRSSPPPARPGLSARTRPHSFLPTVGLFARLRPGGLRPLNVAAGLMRAAFVSRNSPASCSACLQAIPNRPSVSSA